MTTTAASRAAAGAMADSARAWHTWFGGAHQAGSDIDPYGPYLIVAAASEARRNLTMFTGAPIPHLSQDTDRVAARTWSLYVLPGSVYRRLARATGRGCEVTTVWGGGPFAEMPTEADLASAFVRAMSRRYDGPHIRRLDGVWVPPPSWEPGELGEAVRAASEHIGWRNVATIAAALADAARPYPGPAAADIAAILAALTIAPAGTS